jgi:hypothetical protein
MNNEPQPTQDLTDEQFDIADRIDVALEAAKREGLTPSQVARKAHTTTAEAAEILDWMTRRQMAHTSGNGAWTHYHKGRA